MRKFISIFTVAILIVTLLAASAVYTQAIPMSEQRDVELNNPQELTLKDFGIEQSYIVNENINSDENDDEIIDISDVIKKYKTNKNQDIKTIDVLSMIEDSTTNLDVTRATPDSYEPNNSFGTAYPFSQTTKMTGNPFIEGYTNAGIHDTLDNDYFSIYLSAGTDYFFHLKNLTNDFDMVIVDPTMTQMWHNAQYGTTEEYFYFNPTTSGTYYIAILGNGLTSSMNYFLFAGPAIVTKTLNESTGLTFNFNGAGSTSYLNYSTIGKIPANAVLDEVRIDSNGTGYWIGLTKYLKAENGSVYSCQQGTGLDYIIYPTRTQYAAQNWRIAGAVTNSTYFTWKPNIRMTYTYVVEP